MVRVLHENGIIHHVRVTKSTRMNWGTLWKTEAIIQLLMRYPERKRPLWRFGFR
jgi:hypothetical protein